MLIYSVPTGPIGTNTYLVYDEDTKDGFIVDPGGYSNTLTAKVKEDNVNIEYIMITHGHADHIMGIPRFKEDFPDAKVLAPAAEKEMLSTVSLNISDQFGQPISIVADVYVNDNDEMTLGGMDILFFNTPGHTPGGMCIYIKNQDALFCGDTLFYASIGRTDFPGGSYEDIIKSIQEKIFALPDDTRVYPGHMQPTTVGYEKVNNPFAHI